MESVHDKVFLEYYSERPKVDNAVFGCEGNYEVGAALVPFLQVHHLLNVVTKNISKGDKAVRLFVMSI